MKYNKCFELLKVALYFLPVISLTWKARVALTLSDFIISVKKEIFARCISSSDHKTLRVLDSCTKLCCLTNISVFWTMSRYAETVM